MRTLFTFSVAIIAAVMATATVAAERRSQAYAPRNDDFAKALELKSDVYATAGNIYYATREVGEIKFGTSSIGRTVWYKFKATKTGRAVALLTTANMDTAPLQIQAFSGKLGGQTVLAKAQVAGTSESNAASVSFATVKGKTYYLQIDSAPQTYSLTGDFLIALQQFGSDGGIGALTYQPLILREDSYEDMPILVANGFGASIDLQAGISNIGTYVSLDTTASTLATGGTQWFEASDRSDTEFTSGKASGNVQFTAFRNSSGAFIGSKALPITVTQRDYTYRPSLLVRFATPGQGARQSERITSKVSVRNTSATSAKYCRFAGDNYVYGLKWAEVLASGAGSQNAIFDIPAGRTKTFTVSAMSSGDYSRDISLSCSSYYATYNNDYLSSMWAYNQYGSDYSSVKIGFPAANELLQIAIPDYNSRKVVASLTNTGAYSGYFNVDFSETNSNVQVDSICESDASGNCIGASSDYSAEVNLALGETGYVTLSVGRRNATDVGIVYVGVDSIDSPDRRSAGYSGFEVTE